MSAVRSFTAFADDRRLASGPLATVAGKLQRHYADGGSRAVQVFEDISGDLVPLNTPAALAAAQVPQAQATASPATLTGPVTLLARDWEWLHAQGGGASAVLRTLVHAARRSDAGRARLAKEAAYRFLSMMLGDQPGFEEATRALFAGDGARFRLHAEAWPEDLRAYALTLSEPAFATEAA